MFRLSRSLFALCALAAPTLLALPSALAQDDEAAGHSRGGYAWGEEHREESGSGPAAHRYGRAWVSLGFGPTVRIIQYETLNQDRQAPAYMQLRGGYFFEGEGMFQHGAVLGVATNLMGDGGYPYGVDPLGQWTLTPAYMVRLIPDGDLGDWFQATGRVGIPLALGDFFSWGWEVGIGAMVRPLAGFAIYGEVDLSMYFATDIHPLISFEIGIAIDYEVLP